MEDGACRVIEFDYGRVDGLVKVRTTGGTGVAASRNCLSFAPNAFRSIAAASRNAELPAGEAAVTLTDGAYEVVITVPPVTRIVFEDPDLLQLEKPPLDPKLSELDELIVAVVTEKPVTMTRLANLCDHDTDSAARVPALPPGGRRPP
jgi:hypothetical protein